MVSSYLACSSKNDDLNSKNLHLKYLPFTKNQIGVESRVSRVDFLRLTRSESSRKVPTHFEHYLPYQNNAKIYLTFINFHT